MPCDFFVSKFGGSSVRDAEAMKRCSEIVLSKREIGICILSATYNTTNELEKMASVVTKDKPKASDILNIITSRHKRIAEDLNISSEYSHKLEVVIKEGAALVDQLSGQDRKLPAAREMDEIYSLGERMSSILFAGYLATKMDRKIVLQDARQIIKTDSRFMRARPEKLAIRACCKELLAKELKRGSLIITQGFIGSNSKGETTTLGREGSDFSAALIAEGADANGLYIWTDVPGVMSSDPKVDKMAIVLKNISYGFAESLAHLGAKVLFPETMLPVKRAHIPLYVGSSITGELGTLISSEMDSNSIAKTSIKNLNMAILCPGEECNISHLYAMLISNLVNYHVIQVGHSANLFYDDTFDLESVEIKDLTLEITKNVVLLSYIGPKVSTAKFQTDVRDEVIGQGEILATFGQGLSYTVAYKVEQ